MDIFFLYVASTYAKGIIYRYFWSLSLSRRAECPLPGHSEDLCSLRDYRSRRRLRRCPNIQDLTVFRMAFLTSVMSASRSRSLQSDITVHITNDWRYSVRGVGRRLGMCYRVRLRTRSVCTAFRTHAGRQVLQADRPRAVGLLLL